MIELQIDEIWMEFCCEEKFTAKQEFVETETKKYEFEEETEIVEDFGKVSLTVQFLVDSHQFLRSLKAKLDHLLFSPFV